MRSLTCEPTDRHACAAPGSRTTPPGSRSTPPASRSTPRSSRSSRPLPRSADGGKRGPAGGDGGDKVVLEVLDPEQGADVSVEQVSMGRTLIYVRRQLQNARHTPSFCRHAQGEASVCEPSIRHFGAHSLSMPSTAHAAAGKSPASCFRTKCAYT